MQHSKVAQPILCKYRDFREQEKDLSKVIARSVKLCYTENILILVFVNTPGDVRVKVAVDESVGFVVEGSFNEIPSDYQVYKTFKRTM